MDKIPIKRYIKLRILLNNENYIKKYAEITNKNNFLFKLLQIPFCCILSYVYEKRYETHEKLVFCSFVYHLVKVMFRFIFMSITNIFYTKYKEEEFNKFFLVKVKYIHIEFVDMNDERYSISHASLTDSLPGLYKKKLIHTTSNDQITYVLTVPNEKYQNFFGEINDMINKKNVSYDPISFFWNHTIGGFFTKLALNRKYTKTFCPRFIGEMLKKYDLIRKECEPHLMFYDDIVNEITKEGNYFIEKIKPIKPIKSIKTIKPIKPIGIHKLMNDNDNYFIKSNNENMNK